MYLTQAAVYDAWAAFTQNARPTAQIGAPPAGRRHRANKIAATSQAAYRRLAARFPNQADIADFAARPWSQGLSTTNAATNPNGPDDIGYAAAETILAAGDMSGSNGTPLAAVLYLHRAHAPHQADKAEWPHQRAGGFHPAHQRPHHTRRHHVATGQV